MLSVRLPQELEKKVRRFAASERLTTTEVVRTALEVYVGSKDKARSSYDLGKDLFGKQGSGRGDLSVSYKRELKGRIRAKYSH